jgi:hypothetical protein
MITRLTVISLTTDQQLSRRETALLTTHHDWIRRDCRRPWGISVDDGGEATPKPEAQR